MTDGGFALDEGLRARFRAAGASILWRPAPRRSRAGTARRARVAHLHDEEARVESWGGPGAGGVAVDSGPVGALVILLEVERRGLPSRLETRETGDDPSFPQGALVAVWGGAPGPPSKLRPKDLIALARYALV